MKTHTITTYSFQELSDDIREQVIKRELDDMDYTYYEHEIDEGFESIKFFCEYFNIEIDKAHIDVYGPCYVHTNATPSNFRGVKLKSIPRDYMPTGYYVDWYLWEVFYDRFKESGNAFEAFLNAIESATDAIKRSCEDYYQEDSIIARIDANEYEFLEDGTIFN